MRQVRLPDVPVCVSYEDCGWCKGKNTACLACAQRHERLLEYKRQFPDGPKPILTLERREDGSVDLDALDASDPLQALTKKVLEEIGPRLVR